MTKRWNKNAYAHQMVAHVQREMAEEIFETRASQSDEFYKRWDRAEFVRMVAPTLRDHARAVLSEMLGRHDVTDADKESIYEALMLDSIVPNESRPSVIH